MQLIDTFLDGIEAILSKDDNNETKAFLKIDLMSLPNRNHAVIALFKDQLQHPINLAEAIRTEHIKDPIQSYPFTFQNLDYGHYLILLLLDANHEGIYQTVKIAVEDEVLKAKELKEITTEDLKHSQIKVTEKETKLKLKFLPLKVARQSKKHTEEAVG
ncbi:hypothetical protein [Croceiramulus getboli]|nr:hypothetical protein P8624_06840 [Flavobacteriaceae bacterium YJPT1-3]